MTPTAQLVSRLRDAEIRIRQLQAQTQWGDGDPNGAVDGPKGADYADRSTGDRYMKTTDLGTLTGWMMY